MQKCTSIHNCAKQLHNYMQLYATLPIYTHLYATIDNCMQLCTIKCNYTHLYLCPTCLTKQNYKQLYTTISIYTTTICNYVQPYIIIHICTKLCPILRNITIPYYTKKHNYVHLYTTIGNDTNLHATIHNIKLYAIVRNDAHL
jgi:hypothetical protein